MNPYAIHILFVLLILNFLLHLIRDLSLRKFSEEIEKKFNSILDDIKGNRTTCLMNDGRSREVVHRLEKRVEALEQDPNQLLLLKRDIGRIITFTKSVLCTKK